MNRTLFTDSDSQLARICIWICDAWRATRKFQTSVDHCESQHSCIPTVYSFIVVGPIPLVSKTMDSEFQTRTQTRTPTRTPTQPLPGRPCRRSRHSWLFCLSFLSRVSVHRGRRGKVRGGEAPRQPPKSDGVLCQSVSPCLVIRFTANPSSIYNACSSAKLRQARPSLSQNLGRWVLHFVCGIESWFLYPTGWPQARSRAFSVCRGGRSGLYVILGRSTHIPRLTVP